MITPSNNEIQLGIVFFLSSVANRTVYCIENLWNFHFISLVANEHRFFFYLDPFAVFFSHFEWYLKKNVMFDDVKCTIFLITVQVPFCDIIFLFVLCKPLHWLFKIGRNVITKDQKQNSLSKHKCHQINNKFNWITKKIVEDWMLLCKNAECYIIRQTKVEVDKPKEC